MAVATLPTRAEATGIMVCQTRKLGRTGCGRSPRLRTVSTRLPIDLDTLPAMESRFVDPLGGPEWDRLVRSHPESTFFHCAAWARVLSTTYGHKPVYLHCVREGKTAALFPVMEVCSRWTGRRGVCFPFTDACGPLIFDTGSSGAVMDRLFQLARERKWKHLEVRGGKAMPDSAKPAVAFYAHTLDLRRSPEVILGGFASSVRRAIRKAEGSKLSVQIFRSPEAIAEYYRLHVLTRKRHGLPPQPWSFFANIQREVIEAGFGFVVLVSQQSRSVAGAVFFHFGKGAVYKFGASDEAFQEFRGNNLVMWEGIRFLAQNGFETLDFGRTSLHNDGLRRFKQSWGTAESRVEYFKLDTVTQSWSTVADRSAGRHNAVFGRLPLAVNRLAGAIIYPHLD